MGTYLETQSSVTPQVHTGSKEWIRIWPYHASRTPTPYQLSTNTIPAEYQHQTSWTPIPYQLSTNTVPAEHQQYTNWTPTRYQLNTKTIPAEHQHHTNWTPTPYQLNTNNTTPAEHGKDVSNGPWTVKKSMTTPQASLSGILPAVNGYAAKAAFSFFFLPRASVCRLSAPPVKSEKCLNTN